MKNGRMQAKDIDDREFLALIRELSMIPTRVFGTQVVEFPVPKWVSTYDIGAARPDWPYLVFQAKCRAMIRRGLMTGCPCGCRGDYELTEEGAEFLALAQCA